MAVTYQWIPTCPFAQSGSSLQEELHVLALNRHPRLSRIVILLWSLWKSRNALIFKNEAPSPMATLLRAKRSWAEWTLRKSSSTLPSSTPSSYQQPPHPSSTHFVRWSTPIRGFIKLNFDGSKSSTGAAAGFVLRNWQGGFIMAGTRFMAHAPVLVAEATAMRDGIRAALDAGYRKLLVEGDNQIVIKAIHNQIHVPWRIASLIEDIRNMIISCESISFTHIYREGNMAADWMAKYGCLLRCTSLSTFSSPPCRDFLFLLVDDNLGRTLERRAT
uniref:RNase H type-1 domain-containing protein n=1 Tax=Opuntia streptacantha TaxID=393608 RepID=A0A7C9DII2_OPUST